MPEKDGMVETINPLKLQFKINRIYFKIVGLNIFISNMIDVSPFYEVERMGGYW